MPVCGTTSLDMSVRGFHMGTSVCATYMDMSVCGIYMDMSVIGIYMDMSVCGIYISGYVSMRHLHTHSGELLLLVGVAAFEELVDLADLELEPRDLVSIRRDRVNVPRPLLLDRALCI